MRGNDSKDPVIAFMIEALYKQIPKNSNVLFEVTDNKIFLKDPKGAYIITAIRNDLGFVIIDPKNDIVVKYIEQNITTEDWIDIEVECLKRTKMLINRPKTVKLGHAKHTVKYTTITQHLLNQDNGWVCLKSMNAKELNQPEIYFAVIKELHRIHGLNIYHGDLQAQNVFFNFNTGQARLIDFGTSYVDGMPQPRYVANSNQLLNDRIQTINNTHGNLSLIKSLLLLDETYVNPVVSLHISQAFESEDQYDNFNQALARFSRENLFFRPRYKNLLKRFNNFIKSNLEVNFSYHDVVLLDNLYGSGNDLSQFLVSQGVMSYITIPNAEQDLQQIENSLFRDLDLIALNNMSSSSCCVPSALINSETSTSGKSSEDTCSANTYSVITSKELSDLEPYSDSDASSNDTPSARP